MNKTQIPFRFLQIAAVSLFLGRAWQHFFWDAPFRTLLWDEAWMKPIIEGPFQTPWDQYITSMEVDTGIQWSIYAFGVLYVICALIAAFITKLPKSFAKILWLGSAALLFLAALYCKEKFFSIGQLLEYSLQIMSPLLLYFWVYPKVKASTFRIAAKIAIALTFTCHGLYAVGYYPLPGQFVEMVMNSLGVSESIAVQFLMAAGILDFIASILIFMPKRIGRLALAYVVFWGLATTCARFAAYLEFSYLLESLHQWTWQFMIRVPHFLIPMAILIFQIQRSGIKIPTHLTENEHDQPVLFPET